MTVFDALAGVLGALALLSLIVWLWRFLSTLLPESQRTRRRSIHSPPTASEKDC